MKKTLLLILGFLLFSISLVRSQKLMLGYEFSLGGTTRSHYPDKKFTGKSMNIYKLGVTPGVDSSNVSFNMSIFTGLHYKNFAFEIGSHLFANTMILHLKNQTNTNQEVSRFVKFNQEAFRVSLRGKYTFYLGGTAFGLLELGVMKPIGQNNRPREVLYEQNISENEKNILFEDASYFTNYSNRGLDYSFGIGIKFINKRANDGLSGEIIIRDTFYFNIYESKAANFHIFQASFKIDLLIGQFFRKRKYKYEE